jgi:hypothetical protein
MGELVFHKNQYGIETLKGTAVPSTRRWLGTVKLPTDRKPTFPQETLGLRAKSIRSAIYQVKADPVTLALEDAYYQALPMACLIFFKGAVTGEEITTGQHDYLWTFTPSMSATNAQDAVTLQTGNDEDAYQVEYLMGRKLKLAGKFGQDKAVTLELDCFGKQVTPVSFTAAIAPFVGTPMIANMAQVYLDPSWATVGTTKKTGLFREFDIEFTNGLHQQYNGDGLAMTKHGEGYFDAIVTLTFEDTSEAGTIWTNFRAQTPQALRLELPGALIGTGEASRFRADLWGEWEDVRRMDSEDEGDDLCVGVFHTILTPDAANFMAVDVVTDINSETPPE